MSSARRSAFAPNVCTKRRSSPATVSTTVFEVPWPGARVSPPVSTPRASRSCSRKSPKGSAPTFPTTVALTPRRVRTMAVFAAQPPGTRRKSSVASSSPAVGSVGSGGTNRSATTMPAQTTLDSAGNEGRPPDVRVREDVELVPAARGELGDDRAFRACLEPVQGVGRDGVLLSRAQDDLAPDRVGVAGRPAGRLGCGLAVDVQVDEPPAAAEGLLLAGRSVERRMAMLGARLSGEEDELLRADPLGVHVGHEHEPRLLEVGEPEVGDLDRLPLLRVEHDAGLLEDDGGAGPGLLHLRLGEHR